MERDREATERKLLDTIGQMIAENGFENIGVNAVSARSGVSKILIYRYFGSVDGLVSSFIQKNDFWLSSSFDFQGADLPATVKKVFNEHIEKLRTDPVLRKLYRWELSSNNELITAMRAEREKVGMDLIRQVCELTGRPQQEVAALAAIITSSVAYLAMLADTCSVYNGIYVDSDEGWNQISREIQNLVDKLFES